MARIGITGGGLGLGHGGVRLAGGGAALDADAVTLIAAMTTTPDATRQTLISDTIVALKTAGIWDELDECWFMAAHAEQAGLLGWKRYRDLLAVNAPTFTADRGFAGNGTTSYLNTQFVPSTHGVQYTLDDASAGIYSRSNSAADVIDLGVRELGDIDYTEIVARTVGGQALIRMHHPNAGELQNVVASSLGLTVSRRSASNAQQIYRNGASIGSNATASVGLANLPIFICVLNSNSTPSLFSTRQYAFAFVGAALSEAQQLSLYNIVHTTYLTPIGAAV